MSRICLHKILNDTTLLLSYHILFFPSGFLVCQLKIGGTSVMKKMSPSMQRITTRTSLKSLIWEQSHPQFYEFSHFWEQNSLFNKV
jgi:hypothetical protein